MNSIAATLTTLSGVLAFVLVTGALTGAIIWPAVHGLLLQWRERGLSQDLARAEGWRDTGHGIFDGVVGERQWRGGAHAESEGSQRWTEFHGGVPGVSPAGFQVAALLRLGHALMQSTLTVATRVQRPIYSGTVR